MNTITVEFEDNTAKKLITKKDTVAFVNSVLDKMKAKDVQLSVSFITAKAMQDLNREYRSIDSPTDILSFACQDDVEGFDFIVKSKKKNIGDMLICPEVMAQNAETFNVSVKEELYRLLVHGTLHLCGMDHKTNDMMSEPMLVRQEKILKELFKG